MPGKYGSFRSCLSDVTKELRKVKEDYKDLQEKLINYERVLLTAESFQNDEHKLKFYTGTPAC